MKRMVRVVTVVVVLLAVAGCGMITSGESAAEQAGEIATFTVPAGFEPDFGMDVGGMALVGYNHSDGRSHLYVIQSADENVTQAELEQTFQSALASSQDGAAVEATEAEQVPVTIRGQQVTGVLGTGVSSSDNTRYRVLTVPFVGNAGPALLVYERPEASWDQAELDAFIASFQ